MNKGGGRERIREGEGENKGGGRERIREGE
jgi:hypothetical protein